jgi:glycerol-3-phosphate cytidylyltransferase
MLIEESQIPRLPAGFAMVDGCFDPPHRGHVDYFRFAATLGVPVLCNLASDEYIRTHKRRAPLLPEADRAAVIDAIRYVDYVFVTRHGTAWSLRRLRPGYYVKGADWRGRLPPEQVAICAEQGTAVVYANEPLGSSTRILEAFVENQNAHHR